MLSVKDIHFKYKKKIFENLSFELGTGAIVGLLGKNGAGKTTLLKIIAGLLFPHQGKVKLNGFLVEEREISFLEQLYFLPEKFSTLSLTAHQLKEHYGRFYPHFSRDQFDQYLDYFELPSNQKLTTLSFGQNKKTFIAFGLATQSAIILLDEPTNGLDIPSKRKFKNLVLEIKKKKLSSIIISSHQATDLEDIINTVILLEKGRILFNESLDSILKKLYFSFQTKKPLKTDLLTVLEETTGYIALYKNKKAKSSKLNLEILFQALLEKEEEVTKLFSQNGKN